MKIVKPSVEFFGEVPTDYENTLRFIEKCGRLCYKSEDKITPESAEPFVKRLIKSGHLAMVEHSNFVVRLRGNIWSSLEQFLSIQGELGKYLNVHLANGTLCVGGSITAWMQRYDGYADDEQPMDDGLFTPLFEVYGGLLGGNDKINTDWQVCPHNEIPAALHRYSAKFICDRGVSHELVRHRPCSFAQESTRYVNYGGKDMEFIEPWWWDDTGQFPRDCFVQGCIESEENYKSLLRYGMTPQSARAILPNALKTEIVVTADAAEWVHIKKLRTHPSAHPDMVRLMNMMPWEGLWTKI